MNESILDADIFDFILVGWLPPAASQPTGFLPISGIAWPCRGNINSPSSMIGGKGAAMVFEDAADPAQVPQKVR